MITEITTNEEILDLLEAKGSSCLTITLPTHRQGSDKKMDLTVLKGLSEKARLQVADKFEKKEAAVLLQKLEDMLATLDVEHMEEGMGLFISRDVNRVIRFPFPVEAKIITGDSFEIRDVLFKSGKALPYYVLVLTEKGARYFEARLSDLHEIKDKNFPDKYVDDYIYERSFQSASKAGSTYEKSMEKDKSILEEIRLKNFFHHVDQNLLHYLQPATPLLVFGTIEILGYFKEVTRHAANIAGMVKGSYGTATIAQIAPLAWNQMQQFLENKNQHDLDAWKEKVGLGHGTSGLQSVWSAAQEGRGSLLFVEKDFRSPGYITNENQHLYLQKPQYTHRLVADAVDDVIETVLEKGGEVKLLENGTLAEYDRIAMITRY